MRHKGGLTAKEVKQRKMTSASLKSKSTTPARNKGASGSTVGGRGIAKRAKT